MQASIKKIGNSSGLLIPKSLLLQLGLVPGDHVDLAYQDGRLIVTPPQPEPRAGWARDAKILVEAQDDRLAWPEFANADDNQLEW